MGQTHKISIDTFQVPLEATESSSRHVADIYDGGESKRAVVQIYDGYLVVRLLGDSDAPSCFAVDLLDVVVAIDQARMGGAVDDPVQSVVGVPTA